ncbi:inositol polyphosphate multikinase beta [Selaginella moellendorffii]|uniref:inositol polyphosphate multikinase beta n=1 Tax=Selaginella moellendorffii TaxID=88036 RepID=UPI000D1CC8DA|nr:inositol polyphosphate multikinase beta [Selaginella moellendorffii]|eukprot:XP_024521079.1 inositol polyphosphate multikinase beta [Selaginella moellendorffii]
MAAGLIASGLKPSSNQVAGHSFEEGHVGSLVDDSGWFYKPLQDGARGEREIEFYQQFWSDERVPDEIKEFFPKFRGSVLVDTANSPTPTRYAVLEDVTKSFDQPCIIDIKMGFQTWYPEAGEAYRKKCEIKDRESTTGTLGIRVSGMQVYDPSTRFKWKADRNWCRKLDNHGVEYAIRRFVSTNPFDDENPNALLASKVYEAAKMELEKLTSWFEKQTFYHFFSSSVLIIYEDHGAASKVSVKLVDFAHVTYDHDTIDENYLAALKSLTSVLSMSP